MSNRSDFTGIAVMVSLFGGMFAACVLVVYDVRPFGSSTQRIAVAQAAEQDRMEHIRSSGSDAARLGIPANANPYLGILGWTPECEAWLAGYMQRLETSESK